MERSATAVPTAERRVARQVMTLLPGRPQNTALLDLLRQRGVPQERGAYVYEGWELHTHPDLVERLASGRPSWRRSGCRCLHPRASPQSSPGAWAHCWCAFPKRRPLPAGLEPPDHALELLPQALGVRAVLADRQVRPNDLPFLVRSCTRVNQNDLRDQDSERGHPKIDHDSIRALPRGCQRTLLLDGVAAASRKSMRNGTELAQLPMRVAPRRQLAQERRFRRARSATPPAVSAAADQASQACRDGHVCAEQPCALSSNTPWAP